MMSCCNVLGNFGMFGTLAVDLLAFSLHYAVAIHAHTFFRIFIHVNFDSF